jgi:hypothetical protein
LAAIVTNRRLKWRLETYCRFKRRQTPTAFFFGVHQVCFQYFIFSQYGRNSLEKSRNNLEKSRNNLENMEIV